MTANSPVFAQAANETAMPANKTKNKNVLFCNFIIIVPKISSLDKTNGVTIGVVDHRRFSKTEEAFID